MCSPDLRVTCPSPRRALVRGKRASDSRVTRNNPTTMQQVLLRMQDMRAQELCLFSGTSVQRAVDAVADLVAKGSSSKAATFFSQTLSALAHFFVRQRGDEDRTSGDWLALYRQFKRVRTQLHEDPDSVSLSSFEQFQLNKRLLCEEQCQALGSWIVEFFRRQAAVASSTSARIAAAPSTNSSFQTSVSFF